MIFPQGKFVSNRLVSYGIGLGEFDARSCIQPTDLKSVSLAFIELQEKFNRNCLHPAAFEPLLTKFTIISVNKPPTKVWNVFVVTHASGIDVQSSDSP